MTRTPDSTTPTPETIATRASPVADQTSWMPTAAAYGVHEADQYWSGSTANVHDFVLDLDGFVRNELPRINGAIEAGTATVVELMTATRLLVRAHQHAIPNLLTNADRQLAGEITRRLGFIAASIERHAQAVKAAPGDGLLSISGFTEILCAWAGLARSRPCLITMLTGSRTATHR